MDGKWSSSFDVTMEKFKSEFSALNTSDELEARYNCKGRVAIFNDDAMRRRLALVEALVDARRQDRCGPCELSRIDLLDFVADITWRYRRPIHWSEWAEDRRFTDQWCAFVEERMEDKWGLPRRNPHIKYSEDYNNIPRRTPKEYCENPRNVPLRFPEGCF